jgi:hypothetical protein
MQFLLSLLPGNSSSFTIMAHRMAWIRTNPFFAAAYVFVKVRRMK